MDIAVRVLPASGAVEPRESLERGHEGAWRCVKALAEL